MKNKQESLTTPYFMIDENKLIENLEKAKKLKTLSGAKLVLALKCFSTWGTFDTIKPYLDGTTSSGPYEVKLGAEKFGGETHAYSVAYSKQDIEAVKPLADKIIFNSLSQLETHFESCKESASLGLRINPERSKAGQDLADPARRYSRLGAIEKLATALKAFSDKHQLQLYLEPGEAIITRTTDLVVSVIDIVENEKKTAIVDSATEAHRLDTLIYDEPASVREASETGLYPYIIGSCSCLAGDQFCEAAFAKKLQIGQKLHLIDSAGYTMVKLNWFNGLKMPSIYFKRTDGNIDTLKEFNYNDFKKSLG